MPKLYLDSNGNPSEDRFIPPKPIDTNPEIRVDEYGNKMYYYSLEQLEAIRHSISDPYCRDRGTSESVFLNRTSIPNGGRTKSHGGNH